MRRTTVSPRRSAGPGIDGSKWKQPEDRFAVPVGALVPSLKSDVYAKGEAMLHWTAPVPCRILRFSVDPETVDGFEILEVFIGRMSVTLENLDNGRVAQNRRGPVGIPAAHFARHMCLQCAQAGSEHLFGIRWPRLETGMVFRARVYNRTDEAREIRATLEVEDQSCGVSDA
jgi:hypothetical protein